MLPHLRMHMHTGSLWLHGTAIDERSQPLSINQHDEAAWHAAACEGLKTSKRGISLTAPSSCLELNDALRPLLVQYPGPAVSTLDNVSGLEQHLRTAGAAGVGHAQVADSGLASRWRVHVQ